jgi:hypothetical protein
MVTLVAAGCGIWLMLAGLLWRQPLAHPLRTAVAALAMWTIWAIAYLTGMAATPLASAGGPDTARILSAAADRQLAVGIMWAVPAISFVPVVFVMFVAWTRDRPGEEPEPAASADLAAFRARDPSAPAWLALPGRPLGLWQNEWGEV